MSHWPESVEWHEASGTLRLLWPSEPEAQLSATLLRESCRCAACEQARRNGNPPRVLDAVMHVVNINPVGSTGLQLTFSDGHERGIYPWPYLKQLAAKTP